MYIRNYANLIHLKDVSSLQAIINNIHSSCGYVLSHVKQIMINIITCFMLLNLFVIG